MVIMVNEPLTLTPKESPRLVAGMGRGFLGRPSSEDQPALFRIIPSATPKESPDQSRGALLCGAGLNRLVQILGNLI